MARPNMINDASNDKSWPDRTVVSVEPVENDLDDFNSAVKIKLSCGHSFYRTFNDPKLQPYTEGSTARCRTCYMISTGHTDPPNDETIH